MSSAGARTQPIRSPDQWLLLAPPMVTVRRWWAAKGAGADRYVMVSYLGAGPDHGVDPSNPFHAYAEAKAAADEHLRGTDLDWTILGPSGLTLEEPTGRIDTAASESGTVSRGNVARTIVAALAEPGSVGKFVTFNDGEQEIGEAFASLSR